MAEAQLVCPRKRCNRTKLRAGVLPQCPACSGVWIPEATLHEHIAAHHRTPPKLDWSREARVALMCLVCKQPMETLCLYNVPIDRCKGHGIWLDGGELEQVLLLTQRARRSNDGVGVEVVGDVAVAAIEIGVETTLAVAEIAADGAHAAREMATRDGSARGAVDSDVVEVDGDAAGGAAVGAAYVQAPSPGSDLGAASPHAGGTSGFFDGDSAGSVGEGAAGTAEAGGGAANLVGDSAHAVVDGTGSALEATGDVASAAAEGAGSALGVVGDVIGTVAEGTVTVVGAVASGTVKVIGTVAEGLLDGLGSILDF